MTDTMNDKTTAVRAGFDVHWLGDKPPRELEGAVAFGAPLPRGTVASIGELEVVDETGDPVQAQLWPLATWPDGSLKWAAAATADTRSGYRVRRASGDARADAASSLRVTSEPEGVRVDTGAVSLVVSASGPAIVTDVRVAGRQVARDARLVSVLQTTPPETEDRRERVAFESEVSSVEVEQHGPVRAVVRVEGIHRAVDGDRAWLPFTVRMYFTAGRAGIRIVHSFVWDGDAERDFLAGLGLRVTVPLRAALHDRHVGTAQARRER